jgi:hypothetical protein
VIKSFDKISNTLINLTPEPYCSLEALIPFLNSSNSPNVLFSQSSLNPVNLSFGNKLGNKIGLF